MCSSIYMLFLGYYIQACKQYPKLRQHIALYRCRHTNNPFVLCLISPDHSSNRVTIRMCSPALFVNVHVPLQFPQSYDSHVTVYAGLLVIAFRLMQ